MTDEKYKEIGNKSYVKYKELKKDDVIVEDAVFLGTETNQYQRLNFLFEKEGQITAVPECGALKYHLKVGNLKKDSEYKLVYDGMGKMTKGAMAGKDFHKVRIFSVQGGNSAEVGAESEEDKVPF